MKRNCKCRLCDEALRFGSKRPPRCSECGKHPLFYDEMWSTHCIQFSCDPDSGIVADEGILSSGDPVHVMAQCECGHRWRVKGAIQITNIPGHPDAEPAEKALGKKVPRG